MKEQLHVIDIGEGEHSLYMQIYGVKIFIKDTKENSCLVVQGYLNNITFKCLENHNFIRRRHDRLYDEVMSMPNLGSNAALFINYLDSFTLKEYLLTNDTNILSNFMGIVHHNNLVKTRALPRIISDFLKSSTFQKRSILMNLLCIENNSELSYLTYLLYDTISHEDKQTPDNNEQIHLFESLPFNLKTRFKGAMKETLDYTTKLMEYTVDKLPLEQRICLMKTDDMVKEKAMTKLKEVKSKTDDNGIKARQYLEGLLKIPFSIYKREEIFDLIKTINVDFKEFVGHVSEEMPNIILGKKEKYTISEMVKYVKRFLTTYSLLDITEGHKLVRSKISKLTKAELHLYSYDLQSTLQKTYPNLNLHDFDFIRSLTQKALVKAKIVTLIHTYVTNYEILEDVINSLDIWNKKSLNICKKGWVLQNNIHNMNVYLKKVSSILDSSVYGHEQAKRQIERIIGQWLNGEDSGYCMGFEGPPGVGKTSLAKHGLSKCLVDEDGVSRPFSFIAIGGSSNGSTLEGHNYTYVGSTWGRIVDILMVKGCMNPIIFIDELDKVSRTENGREIVSILTHLIDPTQNEHFQDKYFSGVNIDLSKALFVFSYNDVSVIDRVLLDRIHRIKFNHLSLKDKLVISRDHLLPELLQKMGQLENIHFSDEVVTFLIETYTCEPGVRKLKELLYEIIGEINLEIMQDFEQEIEIPLHVTIQSIKEKYLRLRTPVIPKTIHCDHQIGIINGLWANAVGQGGIIPIETHLYPSHTFLDFKLTGMQGDVMKESMNVAKTLSWSLISDEQKELNIAKFDKTKCQGIHIHCPEGAVPKDGPSAGTAITLCIYSLFSNKKIKHDLGVTGEINLQGKVTAIGGLELKVLGGIRAGVKHFLFPEENKFDYDKIVEKYKDDGTLDGIQFNMIDSIQGAIKYAIME